MRNRNVILRQARRAQSAEPRAQRARNARTKATIGTALCMAIGGLSAWATWSDHFAINTLSFPIGTVAFGTGPTPPVRGAAGATAAQITTYTPRPNLTTAPTDGRQTTAVDWDTDMSVNGAPIVINIPGTVISNVLNQAILNPPGAAIDAPPYIWSFEVDGMSPESVGLEYTMTILGQGTATDGTSNTGSWYYPGTVSCTNSGGIVTNCTQGAGWGNPNTLLAYSTLQIYPGPSSGDCSEYPAMPDRFFNAAAQTAAAQATPDRSLETYFNHSAYPSGTTLNGVDVSGDLNVPNVYIYQQVDNGDDTTSLVANGIGSETVIDTPMVISKAGQAKCSYEDQAAGNCDSTAANKPSADVWCVALKFIDPPDQAYSQQAWVTGVGDDQNTYSAIQKWGTLIASPPSLPALGYFLNTFTALGDGCAAALATGSSVACTDWNSQGDTPWATDSTTWWAKLYPDPDKEPDLVIQLTPTVIPLTNSGG